MKPTISHITTADTRGALPFESSRAKYRQHDHFNSLYDFQQWLESPEGGLNPQANPATYGGRNAFETSKADREHAWTLGMRWDQARVAAFQGWHEGGEQLRALAESLVDFNPETDCHSNTNDLRLPMDESGACLDIGAYLSGDDAPWISPRFDAIKPQVNIACNISASAAVDADSMLARGLIVAAAVRKLEILGYAVRVFVVKATSATDTLGNFTNAAVFTLLLKDTDQVTDDSTLAFWLAHPAAMRRMTFRWIESMPANLIGRPGYGYPADVVSPDFHFISDAAHLTRAKGGRWLANPAAARAAMVDLIQTALANVS